MRLEQHMLDLTNKGQRVVLNARDKGLVTVGCPVASVFGSAVVELKKSVAGRVESFSPAKNLNASTPVVADIGAQGVGDLVAEVTTEDASAGSVPLFVSTYPPETE